MTYPVTIENQGPKPVWWTTDPAAAAAAAKVGVVYSAEPVKPAIEEPTEFGSVIRARSPQEHDQAPTDLWQLSPVHGRHYWMSQSGVLEVWSELTDVEVLRVGLGEPADQRPDARYLAGVADAVTKIHQRLRDLLADAITSERKNAYEKAIQAVEELAP